MNEGNAAEATQREEASQREEEIRAQALYETRKKKLWLAYVLGAAAGWLGGHRFYIGGRSTGYGLILVGLGLATLIAFVGAPEPFNELPRTTWLFLLALDGILTYFAVQRRNRELLMEALVQQKMQAQAAQSGLSTPVKVSLGIVAVVLLFFLLLLIAD